MNHTAVFFNHSNEEGNKARTRLAEESLETLITWLKTEEGNVGIMGGPTSPLQVTSMLMNNQMLQTARSSDGQLKGRFRGHS